jgi:hypothetical protein
VLSFKSESGQTAKASLKLSEELQDVNKITVQIIPINTIFFMPFYFTNPYQTSYMTSSGIVLTKSCNPVATG